MLTKTNIIILMVILWIFPLIVFANIVDRTNRTSITYYNTYPSSSFSSFMVGLTHRPPQAFNPSPTEITELIVKFKDETVAEILNSKYVKGAKIKKSDILNSNIPASLKNFFVEYTDEANPAFPEFKKSKEKLRKIKNLSLGSAKSLKQSEHRLYKRLGRAPANAKPEEAQLEKIFIFKILPGKSVQEAFKKCEDNPYVKYCQLNQPVTLFQAAPIDPTANPFFNSSRTWGQSYRDLWGLEKIKAEQAWKISQGEYLDENGKLNSIIVAVVDTGVDYNHPDIWDNIWVNPEIITDTNGDGKITLDDADKNGNKHLDENEYVEDMFGVGIGNPIDQDLHGTHVAGTIAAVNNNIGIIGVAPHAKIMPIASNIHVSGEAFLTEIAQCIRTAVDNGADVINNSWGCELCGPKNPVLEEVLQYAYNNGVINVFAAGNLGVNIDGSSPQNMTNTKPIVAAASSPNDNPSLFDRQLGAATDFGLAVDVFSPGGGVTDNDPNIFQPGDNILSLLTTTLNLSIDTVVQNHYLRASGTSMAAPHTVGVVALLLAHNPNLNIEEVRQIIRTSSDPINPTIATFPYNINQSLGTGRINALKALTQNIVLQAKIDFPNKDTRIGPNDELLTITGTAWGEHFQQYQLYYIKADDLVVGQPVNWLPVEQVPPHREPIKNGTLGAWDIKALDPNAYILKLAVTADNGSVFNDMIRIVIAQDTSTWASTEMINPPPGSTITTPEVTFEWLPARRNGDPFILHNLIQILTHDPPYTIDNRNVGKNNSTTVRDIPLSGQPITVRILTFYSDAPATQGFFDYRTIYQPSPIFIRGDSNWDDKVDISDAIFTLTFLFLNNNRFPTCMDAADANDDGKVDISDAITTLNYLFLGDPKELKPPFPNLGTDPTVDNLSCQQ